MIRLWRIEVGIYHFKFNLIPSPFFHKDVSFTDQLFADEYGLAWLGVRVSFYANLKTYTDMIKSRYGR